MGKKRRFIVHNTRSANEIDIHVGQRLRLARVLRGLSQDELGKKVGVTFQQIQKYERGANRVSAGRLVALAKALELEILFFFQDLEDADTTAQRTLSASGLTDEDFDIMDALTKIGNPKLKRTLVKLIAEIAQ
ncbi:MAG: helix-turn-helix transcriptional regulator [Pseudomonadota bacterium]